MSPAGTNPKTISGLEKSKWFSEATEGVEWERKDYRRKKDQRMAKTTWPAIIDSQ